MHLLIAGCVRVYAIGRIVALACEEGFEVNDRGLQLSWHTVRNSSYSCIQHWLLIGAERE